LNRMRGTGSHAALKGVSSGSRSRVKRIAVIFKRQLPP
jgi:hypothetical protein